MKIYAQERGIANIIIYKEPHGHFDSRVCAIRDNVILANGYWQSEKYFVDFADHIRSDFIPYNGSISDEGLHLCREMMNTMSVAVHIRRGDYITVPAFAKVHGVLPMEYYFRAINYIREKVDEAYFYIFSDDIKWCRDSFKDIKNVRIVEHSVATRDHEDLWLMSQCKHNIIANSSYSWWGAWINENPNKVVISPERWFLEPPFNTKDLIPESWIKI